jgi:hypothetical protein
LPIAEAGAAVVATNVAHRLSGSRAKGLTDCDRCHRLAVRANFIVGRCYARPVESTEDVAFPLSWLSRAPFRDFHPQFIDALQKFGLWPTPEQYDELARRVPRAADVGLPRFVLQERGAVARAGGYERHVAEYSAVPTRANTWHDFFNMAVWAHFPKLRWALNALHVDPNVGPKDPRNGRAPAQNLATTFDECGMLVVSSSRAMLEEMRGLSFKRAFWERRAELLESTRFWLIGHGTLEKLLAPPQGLSVRSLLLHAPWWPEREQRDGGDALRFELDARAAENIRSWRSVRAVLDPIPVLCIPGYADNDTAEFYDDMRNVRFEPLSRRPATASDASDW